MDLLLDVSPMVAVNDRAQPTIATRAQDGALTVLRVGTRDQQVLQARSVVGGVFIKALMDPVIEAKYKVPAHQLQR